MCYEKKQFRIAATAVSVLVCSAAWSAAWSQTIRGRVVSSAGEPVAGCAMIVQTVDSLYVAGGLTDAAGAFSIAADVRPFLLLAQHVSYLPHAARYDDGDVGTVTLAENPQAIGEVVVTGERPLFTLEGGRISYDARVLTAGRTVQTARDVITALPGVYEQGGQIALSGAAGVTVILDGRPTTMTAEQLDGLLRSMPASRVARAEVMYSVPPQYRVRGAAINLVLEKGGGDLHGEAFGGYGNKYYGNSTAGGTLLYSTPRLTLDAAYSFAAGRTMQLIDLTADHPLAGAANHIVQDQRLRGDTRTHNVRVGADYRTGERGSLAAAYTAAIAPRANGTTSAAGTFAESFSDKRGDGAMHNVALDYTSDRGLTLGGDFTHYAMASRQAMHSAARGEAASSFVAASAQNANILSLHAGKAHALAAGWALNYGASFDHTGSFDTQKYSAVEGGAEHTDTSSTLREYTWDAYAGFTKQLSDMTSLSASLSAEHYRRTGMRRWSWFPQMSFQHVFSADHIVQASLSSDKVYPSYWEMQRYVSYLDGYSEIHGNPSLAPMRNYQASLLYYLKQKYMVMLFYVTQPDYFQQSAYMLPDRVALLYQTLNWDYYHQAGVNVVVPFKVGRTVDSRFTATGIHMKVRTADFHGMAVDRAKWLGRVQLDNAVRLSDRPRVSLDVTAYYQTPAIQCTYDLAPSWGVDAGLKWQMAAERLTLSVRATDVFSSTSPAAWAAYGDRNFRMETGRYNRGVDVRLSYRFGKYEERERRKVDSSRLGH